MRLEELGMGTGQKEVIRNKKRKDASGKSRREKDSEPMEMDCAKKVNTVLLSLKFDNYNKGRAVVYKGERGQRWR